MLPGGREHVVLARVAVEQVDRARIAVVGLEQGVYRRFEQLTADRLEVRHGRLVKLLPEPRSRNTSALDGTYGMRPSTWTPASAWSTMREVSMPRWRSKTFAPTNPRVREMATWSLSWRRVMGA